MATEVNQMKVHYSAEFCCLGCMDTGLRKVWCPYNGIDFIDCDVCPVLMEAAA